MSFPRISRRTHSAVKPVTVSFPRKRESRIKPASAAGGFLLFTSYTHHSPSPQRIARSSDAAITIQHHRSVTRHCQHSPFVIPKDPQGDRRNGDFAICNLPSAFCNRTLRSTDFVDNSPRKKLPILTFQTRQSGPTNLPPMSISSPKTHLLPHSICMSLIAQ